MLRIKLKEFFTVEESRARKFIEDNFEHEYKKPNSKISIKKVAEDENTIKDISR